MEDYEIKARALVMSYFLILQDMEKAKQCAVITYKEMLQRCSCDITTQWCNNAIESIKTI